MIGYIGVPSKQYGRNREIEVKVEKRRENASERKIHRERARERERRRESERQGEIARRREREPNRKRYLFKSQSW